MNTKRIEEIQKETAYPDSISVQQALLKVWNECEQENPVKNNAVLPLVNARAFVESCGDMTEYVDGSKIAHRFKKFTIPVIEYNELRKAADKWDSEHVR